MQHLLGSKGLSIENHKTIKMTISKKLHLTATTISLFLILFHTTSVSAQDPEMSQFYAIPVYTNPAMAGTGVCNGGGRAAINYRNQWPGLPGTFITTAASYDQHFDKIGGGIGLILMNDKAGEGILTSQTVSGIYSYQMKISHKFNLRLGIEGQYGQRSIDWQKLRFEDQLDNVANRGFINPTKENLSINQINYANFNTGLLGYSEKFYFGLAVHNLIEPNQSLLGGTSVIPRRYSVHSGIVIPLDKRKNPTSTISPNLLIMKQNKFSQMNLGFYYNKGAFISGLWFRQTFGEFDNSDAMIALIGFRKNKFKFGYSYDFTVSDARSAVVGSHEISAGIEWCAKKPSTKYSKIPCPIL